ncbi:hypothetical protein SAMN05421823_11939 [Catalinimonas alkaloidigena]|uniref:DnaA protein helix-turn-helix n=1 Tax=Catalinimonas alkaloidigena TaxID=1075417 RepID=A0A1G9V7A8_9BACT|nr:hypothetical protein [Catalinimonas alkaloidigena]SDM68034.1 hypothetical protein SAMN05421823_11939 [Catalinimonas alkaloidigena]
MIAQQAPVSTLVNVLCDRMFPHNRMQKRDRMFTFLCLTVCRAGNLSLDQLFSDRRHATVEARALCYFLMHREQGLTVRAIAARFGTSIGAVWDGIERFRHITAQPRLFQDSYAAYLEALTSLKDYQKTLNDC